MKAITTDSMLGAAYNSAYLRMRASDAPMMSSAEMAFELHPREDDPTAPPAVIVYVKIIRFSADRLRNEPESGGLLAEL
jgi:hypothetical protein